MWTLIASWELKFMQGSHYVGADEWLTLPKPFVQSLPFMSNTAFFLGIWNFGTCQAEDALMPHPPVNTLRTKSPTNFSGWKHFTSAVITHSWKLKATCVTPLGEDSQSLCHVLCAFSFLLILICILYL